MSWPIVVGGVTAGIGGAVGAAALAVRASTRDYFGKHVRAAEASGFRERQVTIRPGTVLNVAEGPGMTGDGVPLLLIPGQGSTWQSYAKALPALTGTHRVVVVDVHGHGKSSWNPEDYTAAQIAEDLVALVDEIFGQPVVVAGHSSGGLIAALLAARFPDRVLGVLLEDPPFFATEPARVPHTFTGVDVYPSVTSFLAQSSERDWVCWYLPRSYWTEVFGPLWGVFSRRVIAQRRADPDRLPVIRWLPVSINRIWESLSHPYDLRFSAAFMDDSWFRGVDQAHTLAQVRCPTLFLKAPTRYDRHGTLLAALSEEDLARVEELLADNETVRVDSSHDIHFAQTEAYVEALHSLTERAQMLRRATTSSPSISPVGSKPAVR